jgi:hypothetical protein
MSHRRRARRLASAINGSSETSNFEADEVMTPLSLASQQASSSGDIPEHWGRPANTPVCVVSSAAVWVPLAITVVIGALVGRPAIRAGNKRLLMVLLVPQLAVAGFLIWITQEASYHVHLV